MNRPHVMFYAATLVFLALDYAFGINLRAAFLDQYDVARVGYYLFLLVCLALVIKFPDKAVYIGTVESAVSVGALIISFWVRFLIPTDALMESTRGAITFQEVINFLISGIYGYYSYISGIKRINAAKRC